MIEMGNQQDDFAAARLDVQLEQPALPVGRCSGQAMIPMVFHRKATQHRVAVRPALDVDVLVEDHLHPGKRRQAGRLVHTTRSLDAPVHLLKGHQISLSPPNHSRDPFEIDPPIHPLAVVDVVAQHPERYGLRRSTSDRTADNRPDRGEDPKSVADPT